MLRPYSERCVAFLDRHRTGIGLGLTATVAGIALLFDNNAVLSTQHLASLGKGLLPLGLAGAAAASGLTAFTPSRDKISRTVCNELEIGDSVLLSGHRQGEIIDIRLSFSGDANGDRSFSSSQIESRIFVIRLPEGTEERIPEEEMISSLLIYDKKNSGIHKNMFVENTSEGLGYVVDIEERAFVVFFRKSEKVLKFAVEAVHDSPGILKKSFNTFPVDLVRISDIMNGKAEAKASPLPVKEPDPAPVPEIAVKETEKGPEVEEKPKSPIRYSSGEEHGPVVRVTPGPVKHVSSGASPIAGVGRSPFPDFDDWTFVKHRSFGLGVKVRTLSGKLYVYFKDSACIKVLTQQFLAENKGMLTGTKEIFRYSRDEADRLLASLLGADGKTKETKQKAWSNTGGISKLRIPDDIRSKMDAFTEGKKILIDGSRTGIIKSIDKKPNDEVNIHVSFEGHVELFSLSFLLSRGRIEIIAEGGQ